MTCFVPGDRCLAVLRRVRGTANLTAEVADKGANYIVPSHTFLFVGKDPIARLGHVPLMWLEHTGTQLPRSGPLGATELKLDVIHEVVQEVDDLQAGVVEIARPSEACFWPEL